MKFKRVVPVLSAGVLCLASIGYAQERDVRELLLDCRRQPGEAERLACYDAVADGLESGEAMPTRTGVREPQANPGPASSAVVSRPPSEEADAPTAVRVVDCRRLHDNDYLFTLENGEYWRQAGGFPLRLGKCEFDATITKDFFGHKMQFGHDDRTIRVKRVQ